MNTKPHYSPIAHVDVLHELLDRGHLRGYLLVLTQEVLTYPASYAELATKLRIDFPGATIILDNGVVETGAPCPLDDLLEAAGIVEADIVMAPDKLGDMEGTIELVKQQVPTIAEAYDVMLVPQGGSIGEIKECINWMRGYAHKHTQYWGIPRWITNKMHSRMATIMHIRDGFHGRNNYRIHLLGTSQNFRDDLACKQMAGVIGIDSANPLVLARDGIAMSRDVLHLPRGDYLQEVRETTPLMRYNVEWMHSVITGPQG